MYIHTTKKAISQFKNPTHEVDLSETDENLEILNWSILPFNIQNHQGMLALNDYTNFPLIISQDQPFDSFDDFFQAFSLNLMAVCEALDISFVKIESYLNDIQIDHKTIKQMSNHSHVVETLELYHDELERNIDWLDRPMDPQNVFAAIQIGKRYSYTLNDYRNPLAAFKFEITAKYLFHADVNEDLSNVKIKPTWEPYTTWNDMDGKISDNVDEMESFRLAVKKNNDLMLSRFKRYLRDRSANLRKNALMISYASDYLNNFLLVVLHQTFIHDLSILPAYFAEFMPAQRQKPSEEPVAFDALRKLAEFWEASGQISNDDHQILDHEIDETQKLVNITSQTM